MAAGRLLPWLRGPLPPRYWRKVVAATQGIVLAAVAAGVLPALVATAAVAAALALLTESFGRDVLWLWHHEPVQPAGVPSPGAQPSGAVQPAWAGAGPLRPVRLGVDGPDVELLAAETHDG